MAIIYDNAGDSERRVRHEFRRALLEEQMREMDTPEERQARRLRWQMFERLGASIDRWLDRVS